MPPSRPHPKSPDDVYRVTLEHQGHHWSFLFKIGDGADLLRRIAELAGDPAAPLDGDHAHVLSRQVANLDPTAVMPQSGPEIADRTA
ncbi:MAG: hypothetical protein HKO59_12195 [Phycisphaerales bacterium]|nr:hypothetical protein [Phycisphaerae bacterium]NNF42636.1 hypothetical protein [Phycisphaerales bacterium]NNM26723.1 hypothetical protein [Phycisphaerales bacterium]